MKRSGNSGSLDCQVCGIQVKNTLELVRHSMEHNHQLLKEVDLNGKNFNSCVVIWIKISKRLSGTTTRMPSEAEVNRKFCNFASLFFTQKKQFKYFHPIYDVTILKRNDATVKQICLY